MTASQKEPTLSDIKEHSATLGLSRVALVSLVAFSFFSNILMLTIPIYMLQVYDRVLGSRSLETLSFLTLAAVTALAVYMGLEIIRSRLLLRLGLILENTLGGPMLVSALTSQGTGTRPGVQNVRDLQELRGLFSSGTLNTVLDSPWLPMYLLVLFLFHPVFGWIGVASSALLSVIIVSSELLSRQPLQKANLSNLTSLSGADSFVRNAETIRALGMTANVERRWHQLSLRSLASLSNVSNGLNVFSNLAKFIRMIVQIAALGSGVYLVLQNELTPGLMIAGSILVARALAPLEAAIGSWRPLVSGFQAYKRLRSSLENEPETAHRRVLERPTGKIALDKVTFVIRGLKRTPLNNVSLQLKPGEMLGVAGAIGAGKTTLAKILVGIYSPALGKVFLDDTELASWDLDELGKYIGYAPQEAQIFDGSVAENIARYSKDYDISKVVQAGKRAYAHDAILDLPQGYETQLGDRGLLLSSGQKQRISLARALYGDPRLVVLDEPETFLDAQGEADLARSLAALKRAHITTVVVTHRNNILTHTDKTVVLYKGVVKAFGPTKDVLPILTKETTKLTGVQPLNRKPPKTQQKQKPKSEKKQQAVIVSKQLEQDQKKMAAGKLTLNDFIHPENGSYGHWLIERSAGKGRTAISRLHRGFRKLLDVPIQNITSKHIEEWRIARRDESKSLSGTLERANARHRSEQDIRLLQSCLQCAVEWRLLQLNPLAEPSLESTASGRDEHRPIQSHGGAQDA